MKEDVSLQSLPVAVAAGLLHKQLNAAVDALGQGITEAMLEDADDTGEMGFEGASHFLDGIQLGLHRQHVPLVEERMSVVHVQAALEGAPQFFETPGAGGLQGAGFQDLKAGGVSCRQVFFSPQPHLAGLLQGRAFDLSPHHGLAPTHLVDRPIEHLHQVKGVENQLRVQAVTAHRVLIRLAHVHAHGLDAGTGFGTQPFPEAVESRLAAPVANVEHLRLAGHHPREICQPIFKRDPPPASQTGQPPRPWEPFG